MDFASSRGPSEEKPPEGFSISIARKRWTPEDEEMSRALKRWAPLALVVLAGCQAAASRQAAIETQQSLPSAASTAAVAEAARSNDPVSTGVSSSATFEASWVVHAVDESAETASRVILPAVEDQPANLLKLTLQDAVGTALLQNPDLVATRGQEGVSVAALGVAKTYPWNPQYQNQTSPYARDRDGNLLAVDNQHSIVETFELAHQQRYRTQAGSSALNQVRWSIHQAELLTEVNTERLFFTALYLRDVLQLSQSVLNMNVELEGVVTRQYDAGQATKADVAQVRLDGRSFRRQRELAEANYQTALLDLQRQLNLPAGTVIELVGDLASLRWRSIDEAIGTNPESSLNALVSERPDVLAARADVDSARANLDLADASRIPNVQLGPYYERDESGTTFVGFKGAVDIPIVNTGMPLVRQRRSELRQRQNVLTQLLAKANVDAEAAVRRYERARQIVEAARPDLTEPFPKELRQIEDQFRAGQVDILRVFAARSSLIQNRRAALDALNELSQAAVGVSAATALPPATLLLPPVPQGPGGARGSEPAP
jgi:cobalt-zinc-cadmium efflux system outer membrane protein